jgi:hypothetical protein
MADKEIRFQQLVKTSGTPTIVSLWTDPAKDRPFMKAVKERRVLTLIQEPASKRKDFGRTGFHRGPHAAYLIFPKALPPDARVIGIKYDLIRQPEVSDPVTAKELQAAPRRAKTRRPVHATETTRPPAVSKAKARPVAKTFNVLVRRTATTEGVLTVTARNETEARRRAMETMKRERFDPARAILKNEIRSVE